MTICRHFSAHLVHGAQVLATICLAGLLTSIHAGDDKFQRGRMEDILDVVAKDVQKNFYDPSLNGADWKTIVDRAHERIRRADHLGDMIAAISSVPYQLYDSHTYFIPPGRSAIVDYGFEAEPFANDILVYKLKKDGPAIKARLQLGDKIVAFGGFAAKRGNFFEMRRYFEFLNPSNEIQLQIIRGNEPPQTIAIPAQVKQRGQGFLMDYNAMRRELDAQDPIYTHRNYEGGIGYIQLRTFMLPPSEVSGMLNKVKNSNAVIIDVRRNGGGAVETLTALAGCFTDQPYEMAKAIGREKTDTIKVKPAHPKIDAPLFVLIDSGSASASEIFARDMQLRKRATVIGDASDGRVNEARVLVEKVGAVEMVAFGTAVAVSRIVMADGKELEKQGVTPDLFCVPSSEDLHTEKDPCLDRTLELARKPAAQRSAAIHSN